MLHMRKLTIAIIGAGGIGAYYGARLVAAGHRVLFTARGAHLSAMQTNGLRVNHPTFQFAQHVEALDLPGLFETQAASSLDVVILCTKADTTEQIATQLSAWFSKTNTTVAVLSLQNGVDNEKILATVLGDQVVIGGLAVRIGAQVSQPGCVDATGIGQVIMGVWPNNQRNLPSVSADMIPECAAALREAGVPVEESHNIHRELWRKLVINNAVNPLSTLTKLDTYTLTHHVAYSPIIRGLMDEAAQAALADNIELREDDVNEMHELIYGFDAIKTSMLVDWEKGRQMEIDAICGAVLDRSKKLGIAAPYTRTIATLLKWATSSPPA